MAKLLHMRWFDLFYFTHRKSEVEHPIQYSHAHAGIEFLYIHEGTGYVIVNGRCHRIKPPIKHHFDDLFPSLRHFLSTLVEQEMDNQVFRLSEQQDEELGEQFRIFKVSARCSM